MRLGEAVTMDVSLAEDLSRMLADRLAKHGIGGAARCNGDIVEMKAQIVRSSGTFDFAGTIDISELQRLGPAAIAGGFTAQAIRALDPDGGSKIMRAFTFEFPKTVDTL
jgi:hypothetical protein